MSELALNTIVYTPTGYKLAKDIKMGDYVIGKNGKPTKVLGTCINKDVEMYRITFSDGAVVECGGEQLWEVNDKRGKKVRKTSWFMEKDPNGNLRNERLKAPCGKQKYWIDLCEPVQFKHQDVTIDPYVLGALIGDGYLPVQGTISFAKPDTFIVDKMNERLGKDYCLSKLNKKSRNYEYHLTKTLPTKGVKNKIKQNVKDMGLIGKKAPDKFVPKDYLYNDVSTRLDILNGLMDTDGSASKVGACTFVTVSKQLAEDVGFIVESMGGLLSFCLYTTKEHEYNGCLITPNFPARCVIISMSDPTIAFTLPRKKERTHKKKMLRRKFEKVERIENADTKTIVVDNEDSTFLVEHFVVMSCKVSE